jgi:peptidoglycan/LPS O-acetylase OafA/YrhL
LFFSPKAHGADRRALLISCAAVVDPRPVESENRAHGHCYHPLRPNELPEARSLPVNSSRKQIDSLTGLRAIAAAWVMLMHFREITPTRVWEFPVLDALIVNGAYGVDIFFVLSGFILCHVYASQFNASFNAGQVWQFLVYRFARIYPVHLVTFVMMLALFAAKLITTVSNALPDRYDPVTIITTLTLTHAWFPGIQTPNMPAWSISAEWFAYMLFPLLCIVLLYTKWTAVLYFAMGLLFAVLEPLCNYSLAHVLSGFIIGMAAYRIMTVARWVTIGRFAGSAVAAAVLFWAQGTAPRVEIGLLLFAALMISLSDSRDILGCFLTLRPIVYLGEISYSLYMIHWPARVVVRNSFQLIGILETLPPGLVVDTYVLVTLIGAVTSYHFVELPGRALLRKAGAVYRSGHPRSFPLSTR